MEECEQGKERLIHVGPLVLIQSIFVTLSIQFDFVQVLRQDAKQKEEQPLRSTQ